MKTLNRKRFITLSAIATGFISLFSFCFGSWTFIHDQDVGFGFQNSNAQPVAYIDGKDAIKYSTVKKALDVAVSGETVYVIPGAKNTERGTLTIKSGVTLKLPYGEKTSKDTLNALENTLSTGKFSDESNENLLSSNIKINGTLINKGTLEIGAELGGANGGTQLGLAVQGKYSQITLLGNSKLDNYGTINCYGYIKETEVNGTRPTIVNYSGSTAYMPMCVYDWNGGSYAYACNKADVLPINMFDFPNVRPSIKYNYGSKLQVLFRVNISNPLAVGEDQPWRNVDRTNIIGKIEDNNAFFMLSSGASLTLDYQGKSDIYTTNDAKINSSLDALNITNVKIAGGVTLGNLTMSLQIGTLNASIETSKVLCPISYKFDIEVLSGAKLTFSQKTKFLAGSKMVIDKGATVVFNQQCVFYQENQSLQKKEYNQYPNKLSKSTLINNGTLELNSSFGGFVDVNGIDAVIKTKENFSNSILSKEASTFTKFLDKLPEAASTYSISTSAKGMISYNGLEKTETMMVSKTEYSSKTADTTFFWSATVESNIALLLDKATLTAVGQTSKLSLVLVPINDWFDLNTISWTISKRESDSGLAPASKKNTLTSNGMTATFEVFDNDTSYWAFGTKYATWTYTIKVTISSKAEYGGKRFETTAQIIVKHQ
ncbi:MAG: hypothetical protein SPJ80_04665 [Bacilli bacterium]|nr:hypothetical protein [Bacilli bacterium]